MTGATLLPPAGSVKTSGSWTSGSWTSPPALMLLEADEKLLEVPEIKTELARLPLGGGRVPAVHDDPVGGDDGPGPVFSVAAMDEHGLFRAVPDNVQGLVDL